MSFQDIVGKGLDYYNAILGRITASREAAKSQFPTLYKYLGWLDPYEQAKFGFDIQNAPLQGWGALSEAARTALTPEIPTSWKLSPEGQKAYLKHRLARERGELDVKPGLAGVPDLAKQVVSDIAGQSGILRQAETKSGEEVAMEGLEALARSALPGEVDRYSPNLDPMSPEVKRIWGKSNVNAAVAETVGRGLASFGLQIPFEPEVLGYEVGKAALRTTRRMAGEVSKLARYKRIAAGMATDEATRLKLLNEAREIERPVMEAAKSTASKFLGARAADISLGVAALPGMLEQSAIGAKAAAEAYRRSGKFWDPDVIGPLVQATLSTGMTIGIGKDLHGVYTETKADIAAKRDKGTDLKTLPETTPPTGTPKLKLADQIREQRRQAAEIPPVTMEQQIGFTEDDRLKGARALIQEQVRSGRPTPVQYILKRVNWLKSSAKQNLDAVQFIRNQPLADKQRTDAAGYLEQARVLEGKLQGLMTLAAAGKDIRLDSTLTQLEAAGFSAGRQHVEDVLTTHGINLPKEGARPLGEGAYHAAWDLGKATKGAWRGQDLVLRVGRKEGPIVQGKPWMIPVVSTVTIPATPGYVRLDDTSAPPAVVLTGMTEDPGISQVEVYDVLPKLMSPKEAGKTPQQYLEDRDSLVMEIADDPDFRTWLEDAITRGLRPVRDADIPALTTVAYSRTEEVGIVDHNLGNSMYYSDPGGLILYDPKNNRIIARADTESELRDKQLSLGEEGRKLEIQRREPRTVLVISDLGGVVPPGGSVMRQELRAPGFVEMGAPAMEPGEGAPIPPITLAEAAKRGEAILARKQGKKPPTAPLERVFREMEAVAAKGIEQGVRTPVSPRTGKEIAQGAINTFKKRGFLSLVDQEIDTKDPIASIAFLTRFLRRPYEVSMILGFRGDGKVVVHKAVTSAKSTKSSRRSPEWAEALTQAANSKDIDFFYTIHNHTGGDPIASTTDSKAVKAQFRALGEKYRGEVITDHKHYAYITKGLKGDLLRGKGKLDIMVGKEKFGADILGRLEKESTLDPMYAGPARYIERPDSIARLHIAHGDSDRSVTIVYITPNPTEKQVYEKPEGRGRFVMGKMVRAKSLGLVRAMQMVDLDSLANPEFSGEFFRVAAAMYGTPVVTLAFTPKNDADVTTYAKVSRALAEAGMIQDAIAMSATPERAFSIFGEAPYRVTETPGPEAVIPLQKEIAAAKTEERVTPEAPPERVVTPVEEKAAPETPPVKEAAPEVKPVEVPTEIPPARPEAPPVKVAPRGLAEIAKEQAEQAPATPTKMPEPDEALRAIFAPKKAAGPDLEAMKRDAARLAEGISMEQELRRAPVYYSRLSRSVDAMPIEKGSGEQIAAWLNKQAGARTKEGKLEEMKWTGLDDFLKDKKKVTKQEVREFLDEHRVEVKDVEYSDVDHEAYEKATKFGRPELVLPGGENYRELLLTLPVRPTPEDSPAAQRVHIDEVTNFGETAFQVAEYGPSGDFRGYVSDIYRTREAADQARQRYLAKYFPGLKAPYPAFTRSHWSEPNVLSHVRFNERKGPNGERVLFIEESQSDWHQKARDVYRGEIKRVAKERGISKEESSKIVPADFGYGEGVPPAPFAKTWHELVTRRMVRYAADNGFDRVAWINGEETAKRYDLSKHFSEITWKAGPDKGSPVLLQGYAKDGGRILSESVAQVSIDEYVGKDLSAKIEAELASGSTEGSYSGLDLKVGAEWAEALYDRAIPRYMDDFGKKWGARVESVRLEPGEFQSLPITPAMKSSVLAEGIHMFQEMLKGKAPIDSVEVILQRTMDLLSGRAPETRVPMLIPSAKTTKESEKWLKGFPAGKPVTPTKPTTAPQAVTPRTRTAAPEIPKVTVPETHLSEAEMTELKQARAKWSKRPDIRDVRPRADKEEYRLPLNAGVLLSHLPMEEVVFQVALAEVLENRKKANPQLRRLDYTQEGMSLLRTHDPQVAIRRAIELGYAEEGAPLTKLGFEVARLAWSMKSQAREAAETAYTEALAAGRDQLVVDELKYNMELATNDAAAYQSYLTGAKSLAGRLLRFQRDVRTAEMTLTTYGKVSQALKKQGIPEDIQKQLLDAFKTKPDQFPQMLRNVFKHYGKKDPWWKFLLWARNAGLVTGPATQAVNITSNATMNALSVLGEKMILAPIIEAAAAPLQGREREKFFGTAVAIMEGYKFAFSRDNGLAAFDTLARQLTDVVKFREMRWSRSPLIPAGAKMEDYRSLPTPAWVPEWIVQLLASGYKTLNAFDDFFKAIFAGPELYARRYEAARKAGRSHADSLVQMRSDVVDIVNVLNGTTTNEKSLEYFKNNYAVDSKAAVDAALRGTFQRRLDSQFSKGIQKIAQNNPLGMLLIPFYRTPVNIFKEGAYRLPLVSVPYTMFSKRVQAMSRGERAEEYAKALAGTILGALVVAGMLEYADDDEDESIKERVHITGGPPSDPKLKANWERMGKQAYSVWFPSMGAYVDYSRIEPIATIFGFAADLAKIMHANKKGDIKDAKALTNMVAHSVAEVLFNKTFVYGLAGAFGALQDESRLKSYLSNMEASFIPMSGAVRAMTRTIDPVYRESDPWDLTAIAANLPVASWSRPEQLTATGEPRMRTTSGAANLFPARITKGRPAAETVAEREFNRLQYVPPRPRAKMEFGGELIRFTTEQRQKIAERRQQTIKLLGTRVFPTVQYQMLPDDSKENEQYQRLVAAGVPERDILTKRKLIGQIIDKYEGPLIKNIQRINKGQKAQEWRERYGLGT